MIYEVWDARSGNRLAACPDEEEALQLVREMIEMGGRSQGEDLFVEAVEGSQAQVVLQGQTLVRRALAGRSAPRQSRSRVATMTYCFEFDATGLAMPLAAVNTAEATKPREGEAEPLVPRHA